MTPAERLAEARGMVRRYTENIDLYLTATATARYNGLGPNPARLAVQAPLLETTAKGR